MAKGQGGFAFKQFFIGHAQCAMKVGTDSILLGSWVNVLQATNILDIGTGSGLLAIMMAQKSAVDSRILGIDIDSSAIAQAWENGLRCPWPEKLSFDCVALQAIDVHQQYDLIISNPPYFPHGQQFDVQRQQARHTGELSHPQLIESVCSGLSRHGRFAFVLPTEPAFALIDMAEARGLHLQRQLWVKSRQDKAPTRVLAELGYQQTSQVDTQHLSIYDLHNHYTDAYKHLCRDFYLKF
ncbi:tRNA1(Val) (adenine(37)-N6)-methyltransferase [Bowmanella pacifica]|uniref:tRNA1(Val) (adenine(37)-N6)-methyltransferase n=1 Tax=Bowmanella pacifica TaxID=502051 RepID=A0A918DH40_9ALTE|nr:methyltransferase [Bowmanella pacifica]GGO64107.1 tRNA1(Val) (adenine(37)-N6)-methyltransferase [Bowmanella pacifica]